MTSQRTRGCRKTRPAERAPEQVPVTEEVEHEHQQIAAALEAASAACAAWRARPSAETGEALAAALDQLNLTARPHLDDEDQKVVPLAAVTLTQQEWDAIGKHAVTHIPRNMRGIGFGMLLDALDEDDRAYMMKTVPAPMRLLSPLLVARPWKKYAVTLRTGDLSDPYAVPLPVKPGHHPHSRHAVAVQHRPGEPILHGPGQGDHRLIVASMVS